MATFVFTQKNRAGMHDCLPNLSRDIHNHMTQWSPRCWEKNKNCLKAAKKIKFTNEMAMKGYSRLRQIVLERSNNLVTIFLHNNRFRFNLTLLAMKNSSTYALLILCLRTG